jgi:hypothetical protein
MFSRYRKIKFERLRAAPGGDAVCPGAGWSLAEVVLPSTKLFCARTFWPVTIRHRAQSSKFPAWFVSIP